MGTMSGMAIAKWWVWGRGMMCNSIDSVSLCGDIFYTLILVAATQLNTLVRAHWKCPLKKQWSLWNVKFSSVKLIWNIKLMSCAIRHEKRIIYPSIYLILVEIYWWLSSVMLFLFRFWWLYKKIEKRYIYTVLYVIF